MRIAMAGIKEHVSVRAGCDRLTSKMVDRTCAFLTAAPAPDAGQGHERERATRIESLPLLFFMQPVDTTSTNHHAHDFSSLLLSIDAELAASKEPKNQFYVAVDTGTAQGFFTPR